MVKKSKGREREKRDTHAMEEYTAHSWITPPWCQVPAWSFENRNQAENCGYASGRVVANYLSALAVGTAVVIIAGFGTGTLWVTGSTPPTQTEVESAKSTIGYTVVGAVALIALFKLGLPRVSRYYNGYQYDMYRAKIKSLTASGMSKAKALKLMQKEYLQQMQNMGMMESANIIAGKR